MKKQTMHNKLTIGMPNLIDDIFNEKTFYIGLKGEDGKEIIGRGYRRICKRKGFIGKEITFPKAEGPWGTVTGLLISNSRFGPVYEDVHIDFNRSYQIDEGYQICKITINADQYP